MRELTNAALAVLAVTLALGLAYPLAMVGAAQAIFPGRADGEAALVARDGADDPGRFHARPSVTGYAPDATFFNNLGPNQRELAAQLRENVAAYVRRERVARAAVPPDAVTSSASGVDPHVSLANARIQARRVARERGIPEARVLALVEARASRPLFGLAGERSVNVVELNESL